ncbi:dihydroorotase/N-acyl-D-amino-acid deacylase [Algoriphagus boseongensis]|uniref:Dihydroorotase/N-acyl-D-amino-acid deacylase n=1 Tax=Algoriphagus boseongensis TaxID=1442587 RepID=A0A4R6T752_9BACT|nr:D-aminoacylase [Algoriphagus boseongensis]TDQ16490.1 dihydroorotase/N-acyl-D-amino-acid deacylase [Algoriphagus boseongensis]
MRKLISLFLPLLFLMACNTEPEFDLVILNGNIYDGSGATSISGDIGVKDGKIVAVGNLKNKKAIETIDATGLAVAPGFIDMHTHLEPIKELPQMESLVRQGVTFSLGGPDGGGPWPFGEYLSSLDTFPLGLNVGYLVGHNTIRNEIMGMEDRDPTEEELNQLEEMVSIAMEEGAFGISTGLKYLPGTFSKVDEVISLSKKASEKGGIYTSHLREEGLGLIDAVQEAIFISQEAKIPVILTHHKAIGVKMWGQSAKTLALVDSARASGLEIFMDQYPYAASHTGISVLIPSWALEGDKFEERVNHPQLREKIKEGIIFNILNDRGGSDLRRIQFSRVSWNKELEGKTLHDWAIESGLEPTVENGAELVIQAQLNGGTGAIYHAMDEKDVENIMKHPMTMIGSDGRLSSPGDGHPHPRAYGTFPRVLGHYSRDLGIMPLEMAIYKMTGFPAQVLGLKNRGKIEVGAIADLCIFNPNTVIDQATYIDPHQYPKGIDYVIVNGIIVVEYGAMSGKTPGKVIRKNKQ